MCTVSVRSHICDAASLQVNTDGLNNVCLSNFYWLYFTMLTNEETKQVSYVICRG